MQRKREKEKERKRERERRVVWVHFNYPRLFPQKKGRVPASKKGASERMEESAREREFLCTT